MIVDLGFSFRLQLWAGAYNLMKKNYILVLKVG